MKSYKQMDWEELEEAADEIRAEISRMEAEAEPWESRSVPNMPSSDFYNRLEELKAEIITIQELQNALGES